MVTASGNKFFVAVDGSESSFTAFEMMRDGLFKAGDDVEVAHISNANKQNVPFHYRPKAIAARYQGELLKMERSEEDFVCEEIRLGLSTKETMMELASEREASMMVVGYHGRKGPKSDPTVLGTAVQFLGVEAAAPVAIVKVRNCRQNKPEGAFKWAVCFDGADCSLAGFDQVFKIMDKNKDSLEVITVAKADMNSEQIEKMALDYCQNEGVNASFNVIKYNAERYIYEQINDWVMEKAGKSEYVDFLCLTNNGADFGSHDEKKYLGAVASGLIRHSKQNIIFVPAYYKTDSD